MKNLKVKTFYTIFTIISLFLIIFTILFNIQVYQREYAGVLGSITRMKNFINEGKNPFGTNYKINEDLKNRMVMDYEVYTFILDDENNIIDKISHSDININDKTIEISEKILKNADQNGIYIKCLYFSDYAYNLSNKRFLTIVNIKSARIRLLRSFLISILLVCLGELVNYLITKKITNWITKPVEESFNNQKEFVANASHELKTPLAVMIASIDCLTPNKKNEKWINNLKSESERMNNLITRLLDLSKSESCIVKDNFSVCNISKIIEKRVLTFESLAYEKKITIETNIQDNINFLCNRESIDELITILIDNAINHSEKGNEIVVKLLKDNKEIIIEVVNMGEEIKEEECIKIFERFYRGDKSRNRSDNRYGLGLSIAKNIVEGHDGSISAYSKEGHTTFKVVFKQK